MVTLDDIRRPVASQLEEFNSFVRQAFNEKPGTLLGDMIDYILTSRGKGLRPIITMLSAGALSPTGNFGKRTMLAAMLVEMIHVASLVHDDVIDESNMRRGRASVNARWQSRNAVIVGDYILAKNMDIGLKSGQFDLLNHIIGGMTVLCEGEILQSDHAGKLDTSREAYFDIIYKKTASLFGTCASAGALSVGASHRDISAMRNFGEALGMAFQIVDDILDYTPDNNAGKPAANDLRERKITLPLIEVLERVDEAEREQIIKLVEECATSDEAVESIRERVERYDGVNLARRTMQRFLQRAMSELATLAETPFRQAMMDLCTFVAERDR
ncbi:MAG: polyprenyl synthetase family protein [Alistipes sp.]|nr:polyprenyl synthetase family protein [Alistipes sp.]